MTTMMLMTEKKTKRKEVLAQRDAMTAAEAEEKSVAIAENLMKIKEYQDAAVVLFYAAKGNEAGTGKLIRAAIKGGKKVLLPVTDMVKKEIDIAEIKDYDSELREGAFGILEPYPFLKRVNPKNEKDIDVVIVPGVAFDLTCHRLGYGHGFYDKLLHRLAAENPSMVTIGLSYDFQVVEKLPVEGHDHKLDKIVTEAKTISSN